MSNTQFTERKLNPLQTCLVDAVHGISTLRTIPERAKLPSNDIRPYNFNVQYRQPHSSLGGSSGNLVVDMKNFKKVEVQASNGIATVGPGNTLKTLVEGLYAQEARFMLHGSLAAMPRLAASATTLIVIANGSILYESKDENSDLFWAIRSAGASFGIVTEFKFQTKPEAKEVIDFTYSISSDTAIFANSFKVYHKTIGDKNLEPRLSAVAVVQNNGLIISGSFFGSEADYSKMNFGRLIPGITNRTVTPRISRYEHMRNSFAFVDDVFPANQLPFNTIDKLFKHVQSGDAGSEQWFALMDLYGGSVNKRSGDASAFPHRDLAYFVSIYVTSKAATPQTTKDFVNRAILTIQNNQPEKFLSYVGYSNLRINKLQEKYWGKNLPRFQNIKTRFDPLSVFSTLRCPKGTKKASEMTCAV
ncbi:hypothetical protein EDB80DRAFT_754173 [Ilyonectria destructans]|nr:hypothetical protein EDB80DRAFT_754173 [Ilyonectria destructans]